MDLDRDDSRLSAPGSVAVDERAPDDAADEGLEAPGPEYVALPGDDDGDRLPPARRWSDNRWVRPAVDAVLVGSVVLFTLAMLHPHLLIANTTPAGGDMGAHVWAPAYLRDHLIPHGRLSGWTPDWYDGFPAYQFYMVVPSLMILAVNAGLQGWAALISLAAVGGIVWWAFARAHGARRKGLLAVAGMVLLFGVGLPYGISFKLVTVVGVLSLPICAYAFGRLADLTWPTPALLAVSTLPFLFNREPTINNTGNIIGGNVASTLAGEFAFSISLSIAVLYFGFLIRCLKTGRHRAITAVLLGLVVLCHVIPFFWALGGTAVALLVWPGGRRLRNTAIIVLVGALVSAFWTMPFVLRKAYSNDMGWTKLTSAKDTYSCGTTDAPRTCIHHASAYLAPHALYWLLVLALVGAVIAIALRIRPGIWLAGTTLSMAVLFVVVPNGRLWNARLLPFWFLGLCLLAGLGVAELAKAIAALVAVDVRRPSFAVGVTGAVLATIGAVVFVGLPLEALPGGHRDATSAYQWLGFTVSPGDRNVVRDWATWNYTGYERKAAYPEYYSLMKTMEKVGQTNGCGRAMWEYDDDKLNSYGTPMSPMLLPYWSDTCIGSMEGLYFEASATTPYHFINQGELSAKCSCAQRWDVYGFGEQGEPPSPYRGFDFDLGIKHLQLLGVRYYMAFSTQAVTAADQSPALTPVTTSGPWHIYEIADSAMVTPLANQPAVVTGIDPHKGWVHTSVQWYDDATKWDVMLAESGPSSWQRVTAAEAVDGTATAKAVEQVDVSNITTGDDRISFDVDKVGSPVLVKASYFPNWQVSGAEGPYRVTPNLMVVVPTSKHVSLHYGWTPVDMGAWLLTFAGLGLVALLALIEVPAGQLIQRGLDEQKRRDLARLGHQPG